MTAIQNYPDPEVEIIGNEGLQAFLDTSQTADANGFYVRAGDALTITGNRKVKVAAAGQVVHARALMSIHKALHPNGIDSRTNLQIMPLGFNKKVIRGVSEGVTTAGDYAAEGSTDPQKWKKVAALTATTPAGATAVLSSSAEPAMTLAGGVLPVMPKGIIWVGGADAAAIEVII